MASRAAGPDTFANEGQWHGCYVPDSCREKSPSHQQTPKTDSRKFAEFAAAKRPVSDTTPPALRSYPRSSALIGGHLFFSPNSAPRPKTRSQHFQVYFSPFSALF